MRTVLLYVLFLCSGAAGLIYELVWVRELIFVFGGTTYAITTVLVAFMAGLGLGSFFAGRWCHRLRRPGRVYGSLEIAIGLYALSVPFLLSVAVPVYRNLYPQLADWPWLLNLIRFFMGGLILIIPTTCMGATLPVLVRFVTMHGRSLGRSVGYLYGINAFGAVLGTLAAGFILIPGVGLLHTTWLAAAINIGIGVIAINLLGRPVSPVETAPAQPTPDAAPLRLESAPRMSPLVHRLMLVGFAVSGFAAMVYQITWTRALVLSIGSTTYAFTCILAAFILGLSLGSLAIARWADRWKNPVFAFGLCELLIGLVAVVIVPIHELVPRWVQTLVTDFSAHIGTLLVWQFLLIIAITFVPTFLMGAIFPLVTRALAADGDDPAAATGRAYIVNTVGTIAGSFLAGFVLIRSDVLGVQNSIILASILNALVGVALIILAQAASGPGLLRRAALPVASLVLIPLVALGTGRWDQHVMTAAPFLKRSLARSLEREIVFYAEGVDVTVTVEYPKGAPQGRTLTVNGKPDASTGLADLITMLGLGHLPTLLHPNPKSACLVGLGSGISLSALACHPSFERIDCVEIADEVVKAAAFFTPYNYNVLERDPRVHLILADGRNHLLLTDRKYDLILTQPSNPWMAGVSNLFTKEYFELGKRHLNEGGLMAVWLQSYKSSVPDFQMIVRTLLEVFDHVTLWELCEDDFLMIASREPQHLNPEQFVRRFKTPAVWADLYRAGIRKPEQFLAQYITSDQPLREWVANAPIHTDDNALLEFSAPRYMFTATRRISEALFPLQRSVFTDLVPAATPPPPPPLVEAVGHAVTARWAHVCADATAARGDVVGVLQGLLEAHRNTGDNAMLYKFIVDSRANIRAVGPQLTDDPQIAALLAQIDQLEVPRGAPPEGASLAQIASMDRVIAGRAAQNSNWTQAVEALSEAHEMEPDNGDTMRALSDALVRIGRAPDAIALLDELLKAHPNDGAAHYFRAVLATQAGDFDTACKHLRAALTWGYATTQKIDLDDRLKSLRSEACFQGVLDGAKGSLPVPAAP